jgi:hypothetical protein
MPKTLSPDDPNLLKAVQRLTRSQYVWAALFVALGLAIQLTAAPQHLFSGLPFVAVGFACFLWRDPALLAAVAVLWALSAVPTLNPKISLLGPDPLPLIASFGWFESAALLLGRFLLAYMAVSQFLPFRFLYGSERAASDDPDQPIIPAMIPNRANVIARWARVLGVVGLISAVVASLLSLESLSRAAAEFGGGLAAVAIGLGLGAAFSPTDERPAALLGAGLGALGYAGAALALWRLG